MLKELLRFLSLNMVIILILGIALFVVGIDLQGQIIAGLIGFMARDLMEGKDDGTDM
jgi:hypothetical protein